MRADSPPFARLAALFAGSDKAHGTHGEPDPRQPGDPKWRITKSARTKTGPATPEIWEQHLAGTRPLGVIPVRGDGTCSWGSIDVDEYDVDVIEVINLVGQRKLPLVPCRSKSGGLHLLLFLKTPEPARSVQIALGGAASVLGLEGCEIFPKQAKLDEKKLGNWMCMPYLGTTFGGKLREQRGVKHTGSEMTIGEFAAAGEEALTTVAEFAALVGGGGKQRKTDTAALAGHAAQQLARACAEVAAAPKGDRNNVLNREAFVLGTLVGAGALSETLARERLFEAAMPGDEEKISDTINRGLAAGMSSEPSRGPARNVPVIVSGRMLTSDEPVWYLTLAGSNREMVLTKVVDLTNYQKFYDQCVKQLGLYFSPVSANEWKSMLQEAHARIVPEAAGEDVTSAGRFQEMLDEFLTDRAQAAKREEILWRRPWYDELKQRHEFRMRDLHHFVISEVGGIRQATRHDCEAWIRALGGDRVSSNPVTLAGKGVRLW